MAITHDWNITEIQCYPEKDGKQNVAYAVFWIATAQDSDMPETEEGPVVATETGCAGLGDPTGAFTAYDKLTKDQVIGWVKDTLGAEAVATIENNLTAALASHSAASLTLPWSA